MRITINEHYIAYNAPGRFIFDKLTITVHTDKQGELDSLQMGTLVEDTYVEHILYFHTREQLLNAFAATLNTCALDNVGQSLHLQASHFLD